MVVIVQVVAPSDAKARRRGDAARSRGLVEQFGTDLKLRQELIGDDAARLAEVDGTELADRASAATERRPSAVPVLLNPDWQKQRRAIVTNEVVRPAWKEDAREDADIEPEPVLVKKAVLGGELDVAPTDVGAAADGSVKSFRQGCRQLEVGRRAVVEVNTALTRGAVSRRRTKIERVDLEMLIVGRLRIVGNIGRPAIAGSASRARRPPQIHHSTTRPPRTGIKLEIP